MSDRPRVGVAVLNYRGAADTIACLASLRAVPEPIDIIVVDNGSDDGSIDEIHAAAPDVGLVASRDNLGFGRGNNLAIERFLERGCEFVWLLNNDATVEALSLGALLDIAAADDRLGAVGSVIYHADRPSEVQTWGGGSVSLRSGRTLDATTPDGRVDYITGASALYRSAALRDAGAFDPDYFFLYEDVDLGLRLREHGWGIAVAPESRVWHRGGGTAPALSPSRAEHHATSWVLLMRKHASVPRLRSLTCLVYYGWLALRHRRLGIIAGAWRGWRSGWAR
jgi:GT2 family glycosyltransferase